MIVIQIGDKGRRGGNTLGLAIREGATATAREGIKACSGKKTVAMLLLSHTFASWTSRSLSISKAAVEGSYGDSFFGDPRSVDGYYRRLRAVV